MKKKFIRFERSETMFFGRVQTTLAPGAHLPGVQVPGSAGERARYATQ